MLELKIAKPCDQSWTAMKGDEQVRHCQRCQHNVYNIAEMTEKEVEELIRRTEGKFCARIYRRSDNRIMTRDCPRGVAAVRRRVALSLVTACAALVYGVSFAKREPRTFAQAREVAKSIVKTPVEPKGDPVMGAPMTMGKARIEPGYLTGEATVIPSPPKSSETVR